MDQKHDTHLFVEVNQATKIWSIRQDWTSGSKIVYFTKMNTSEQQKCLMLSNKINLEIEA